jgi:GNAT superfamily N-acetyltransferase
MALFAVSEIRDKGQIEAFLRTDTHYTAYALADLEPPYSEQAQWAGATRDGLSLSGLALMYSGLNPPLLFFFGESEAIAALLLYGVGPDLAYITAPLDLEALCRNYYHLHHVQHMYRMRVTRGTFVNSITDQRDFPRVARLGVSHTDIIESFIALAAETDGRAWGDVAFDRVMVADGFYHGVFQAEKLIAVGGTHVVSRSMSLAAVGNVVVHPEHRRMGLGAAISAAVTRTLIEEEIDLIVLNVSRTNGSALKTYKKLGYRIVSDFLEALGARLN